MKGLSDHLNTWENESKYTNTDEVARVMRIKMSEVMDEYLEIDFLIAAVILDRSLGSNWKKIIDIEAHQETGMAFLQMSNQRQK